MKRLCSLLLLLPLILIHPINAQEMRFELQKPTLPVEAWVLMDYDSGVILAEHNAYKKMEPASLTKIMTSYIAAEAIEKNITHRDSMVRISHNAWEQGLGGSRMFVAEGSQVSVQNLIKGLIIQSGNDASVALAEHIAGSENAFVQLMNQKATELNMSKTHFQNTNGLSHDDHYSSAYDLALLSRALIKNYPEHYKIYSQKSFTWADIRQENRNPLLWIESSGADGIKTGHTERAGYSLASSAIKNNFRVIAVVLKAADENNRRNASLDLLSYAFQNFSKQTPFKAGEKLSTIRLYNSMEKSVDIGIIDPVTLTLPNPKYSNVNAEIVIPKPIIAPINRGDNVGHLAIMIDDYTIHKIPISALETISEASLMVRLWDDFKYKLGQKIARFKEAL